MAKYKIIPVFVPHEGCPHQCSFCNQHHITGQRSDVTPLDEEQKIERYLSTIDSGKHHVEIAFFGGSFTAIPEEKQKQLLQVAHRYQKQGVVHGIRVSTRPDAITKNGMELLCSYGVTEVELGVQSMSDRVLLENGRGHTARQVEQAVGIIRTYPVELGLQMMTGLIGDTNATALETAEKLVALSPDFVRIYPTLVLEGTPLADRYRSGTYSPPTLEQTIALCRQLSAVFDRANIPIIRLGLLLSEEEVATHLLAGPYHPRLKELL